MRTGQLRWQRGGEPDPGRDLGALSHEEANLLALNLAHDIIEGKRSVEAARQYYAEEFLNYRKKAPTPYMSGLKFEAAGGADPDRRILSDHDLERAVEEGKRKSAA